MTKLAIRTAVATLSGISWSLIAVSLLVSTTFLWRVYEATQLFLIRTGVAGHDHCWLCGMSHSFRCIWRGELRAALTFNPHSVTLFGVMLLGCISIGVIWTPPLRNRPNSR